jgi:hypothetical protein
MRNVFLFGNINNYSTLGLYWPLMFVVPKYFRCPINHKEHEVLHKGHKELSVLCAKNFVPFVVKKIPVLYLLLLFVTANAQDTTTITNYPTTNINKQHLWLVAGTHAGLWTASYIALNKTWYANYPRSSFHFFNDNSEWNQMDKLGHVWTAYNVSRVSGAMWKWTGLPEKKAVILGGISAVAYQSIIEIQDGFSAEWGFSWGDMTGNIVGAGAYVLQELGWKDQRIHVKLSYWAYDYPKDLITRRDQLFGNSLMERILKDYNSQTYWVSANLKSFFKQPGLPAWLNIAVGYNSDGMLGGTVNRWTDKQGNNFDRTDIPRIRRFFLSPDIDLTKIKTRSKFLRSAFYIINMVKVPAPAIEINSKGKLKAYVFYY